MSKNSPGSTTVKRRNLLAGMIRERCKRNPEKDFVVFSATELRAAKSNGTPLLQNLDEVKFVLDKMQRDLDPSFAYEFLWHQTIRSTADIDGQNRGKVFEGIRISIDDYSKLEKYIEKIKLEIEKGEKNKIIHNFILDEDATLHLVGSNRVLHMKRGMLPHKLLYNLAKVAVPVSTQLLARRIGIGTEDVRRKLEKLKTSVSEAFSIPRDALIKNEMDRGYCAPTLVLDVPKGYTP